MPSSDSARQNYFRKVCLAREIRIATKESIRVKANATIARTSAGVSFKEGDLVMVREEDSALHRAGEGRKLQRKRYTSPWKVKEVLMTGFSVEVVMSRS